MPSLQDVILQRAEDATKMAISSYAHDLMVHHAPEVEEVHSKGYILTPEGDVKRCAKNIQMQVTMKLTTSSQMANHFGFLHGGFIGYLMDVLTSVCIHCVYDKEKNWWTTGVTQNLQILYLKPVPTNITIHFVSKLVMLNKYSATAEGYIYDDNWNLLAQGIQMKQDVKEKL